MLETTDVKELITILLFRKGLSMRKLVKKMNEAGYPEMTIGGFHKIYKGAGNIRFPWIWT